MCEEVFPGTTEEKLFASHFKPFHKSKKMKAVYVEWSCRLCGKEFSSQKELVRVSIMITPSCLNLVRER